MQFKLKNLALSLLCASAAQSIAATDPVPADSVRKYTDWLCSTMNSADLTDYPRQYWEENVACALRAREELPWGKTVPRREWLHFVLPVRVNNENLDSARQVFYRELAPRLKGMTMTEAALEVNHWCHEKATYRPSDARTSSPLATVRTTFGRCGEESTFGVAAMRAVGIPARQVYTPRWAHTDDNHAWVEVWTDGAWHFLGACEPEPVLDLGWFNAPAARGMMMATNVTGNYDGPEQQLYRDSCYTRINVTANYAPLRRAVVKVVDKDGNPVAGAPVSFRLYNYAELYPLFATVTDKDGLASLLCGKGDLVAWAATPDGAAYGLAELDASADNGNPVLLTVDNAPLASPLSLTLTPPAGAATLPPVTEAMTALNDRRKAYEDSLRNAVMGTFLSPEAALPMVSAWGDDAPRMAEILVASYGNHPALTRLVKNTPSDRRHEALTWLEGLSEKDWRDIDYEIIEDFFLNRRPGIAPRIADEKLTPWLSFFDRNLDAALRDSLSAGPVAVEKWVKNNIAVDDARNPNRYYTSPAGVWRMRSTDSRSRQVFFVALCRALGFDAKIDPVDGRVLCRVSSSDPYTEAFATSETGETTGQPAKVKLTYPTADALPRNPKYYIHFTIARIENGIPQLLNYPEDATWEKDFADGFELLPGRYVLTTGRRLADGTVKARLVSFEVPGPNNGQVIEVPLVINDEPGGVSIIGSFNADPLLPLTGRGTFIAAFVKPNHEPSAHLLNELAADRAPFEAWGRPIVLIAPTEADAAALRSLPNLPSTVKVTVDPDGNWFRAAAAEFEFTPDATSLPLVMVADSFNRVMNRSNGYRPGLVQTLADLLPRLP